MTITVVRGLVQGTKPARKECVCIEEPSPPAKKTASTQGRVALAVHASEASVIKLNSSTLHGQAPVRSADWAQSLALDLNSKVRYEPAGLAAHGGLLA